MGSGNSTRPKSGDRSDFNVKPETLINGGSSISTIDSSHRRKMTDEEKNTNIREADYEDGSLGIMSKARMEEIVENLGPDELFCDPDFPADSQALFYSDDKHSTGKSIVWKRPKDLMEEWQTPQLMIDGMTRDDIKQGILGDCWFLSSCAAVSQRPKYMKKIMQRDQPLVGDEYKGMVNFKFWRFGQWSDVYIDDRLPTKDGKLIYASCTDPQEFWVSLIEKAYAKLHGSYEAIDGGQTMDALVDLTGGLAERYEIETKDPNLYRQILRASKSEAFITCSRKGDWKLSNKADPNGLVSGHAYTITGIEKIQHKMGEDKLVRIRNPWADGTEWKGSWSDNDINWTWVDEETKERLGLKSKDDGEFWMSYKDFCRHFSEVTICLMGPDFDGDGVSDQAGHFEVIRGEWILGCSAGGSRNDLQKFATNPQYLLTLTEPDDFNEETDDPDSEGKCSIVISLMQEHRQSRRNVKVKRLQIGFMLYQTEDTEHSLPARYFKYHPDCGKSGVYINFREVSGRFELNPGHYVIIPSSFKPDDQSAFMLRVFGEKKFGLKGPLRPAPEPE
ncbi:calpain-A-like [Ruditapes philippinarum]|uniref:calpain-A-like n=1 Tax=Ruditapes philippinarum TaxID=129788 RepID=UPI00295BAD2C|nr:calpain-A-like [Ruditapes philippinarum]